MPNYRKYKSYRDTEIPWLGQIPSHWQLVLLSQVVSQVKNKNISLQESNLLSLSYGRIKRKPIDSSGGLLPESFDGYNIIEENDIVLRLTDLQNDHTSLRVGISPERGIITSAYTTVRPRKKTCAKYLFYLLHTFDIRKGFYGMGSGVRQGLNYDEVKRLQIPWPAIDDQIHISEYLDREVDRINTIISEAKSSIKEYKAWKASIIYEAVTKGLSLGTEMETNNSKWFPETPVGIAVSRVGLHYDIVLGKMLCPDQVDPSYSLEPYFCAANVHFSGVDVNNLKEMWFSPTEKEIYKVNQGDLLVVEGGAGAGGSAIVQECDRETYVQNSIMIVRGRQGNSNGFLKYVLECLVERGYVDFVCNKATIPHFTKEKLGNTPYPVFSSDMQSRIASYLDERCCAIDSLIEEKENLISDLKLYEKALIFEVVTGKRRVC